MQNVNELNFEHIEQLLNVALYSDYEHIESGYIMQYETGSVGVGV